MKLSIRLKSPEGGFQRRANLQEGHESLSVQKQRVKKSNNTTSQSVERNLVTSNTQNFGNIKTILPRNSSPRYLFSNNKKEIVKQEMKIY